MKEMPDNSVDSIVTDPPYELGFMGKSWDSTGIANSVEMWSQVLRVLKPGGFLIAFSSSRTYHRMVVAVEDAGFQIRDQLMWVYGSGFPKSMNIGNQLKDWDGWGTALKPAHEPIVLARKPFVGTVTSNLLTYGVGGLNIDSARIPSDDNFDSLVGRPIQKLATRLKGETKEEYKSRVLESPGQQVALAKLKELGRFPANFIHDGSEEVTDLLGDAARFFYSAKVSKRDRTEGTANPHPTVKPTSLMRYLVKLVTPPKGIVLDPFMGSGSTGKACVYEEFDFIGIEQSVEYTEIARARIEFALQEKETDVYELPFDESKVE